MGSGNLSFIDPTIDGESTYKVDQIKRRNASLTWVGNFICDRCSLTASAHSGVDDYVVLPDEIKIQGALLGFSYNLSKRSSFVFNASRTEQKFIGDLLGKDYLLEASTAYYRYEFDAGVSLRFFVEQEERDSDDKMAVYKEKLVGGELTWTIF